MASENPTPCSAGARAACWWTRLPQLSKVRALPLLKPVFMMDSGQLHHIELVGLTDDGLLMLGGDEHWIKSFNRKDDKTMYDMQTLNSLKNLLQTVFDDERRLHVHPDFQECLKKGCRSPSDIGFSGRGAASLFSFLIPSKKVVKDVFDT